MSTETRVHHPYSPSTLESLKACPCYKSREDVVNERAIAGTLAHAVVESREDNNELSDSDTAAAAECLDFCDNRKNLMEAARYQVVQDRAAALWSKDRTTLDVEREAESQVCPVTELKEAYLPIDDCSFDDCKGTTAGFADYILISHDQKTAEMVDFKFGLWHVTRASENLQAISYSLGLFHKFPSLEAIRFFFRQPLANHFTDAVFTRAEIPTLYIQLQVVVERAREARRLGDFSLAIPTVPNCCFCREIGKCPKVLAIALTVSKKFSPLDVPEHITPSMAMDPKNTTLAMRLSQVMAVWASAFRRQVTDRVLRREAEIPEGLEIRSMSKRVVVDAQKFREAVEKYLTADELLALDRDNCLGFGVVEKAITDKAPRGQKKAQVEHFQQTLKDTGAVKDGDSFSFLKAIPKAEDE